MKIVYSRHYDIGFFGLERLHPFDSRKYSHAWRCLKREFGARLRQLHVKPSRPVSRDELLRVHSAKYLKQLLSPQVVAAALELPIVAKLPSFLIDRCVLRPMRWGTMGSMLAVREAINGGVAVNLSGGYHHAKPDQGEGFCIYADVALAVDAARRDGLIAENARVAYIDTDAHQGNGVCHTFVDDRRVFIFDMYNPTIYPSYDQAAQMRIDCHVRVHGKHTSDEYMRGLQEGLPQFLDSVTRTQPVSLAIYNAGTDVYEGDALGGLNVTAEHILERDLFVVDQLHQRGIPVAMLLSGGYSRESYKLVFATVKSLIDRYGNSRPHPRNWNVRP
jgi:histone deacetylase 11